MDGYKEFQGKSLDDAIREACTYFDAPREKLEIDIVHDAKSGIFGIVGVRKAKIRARRVRIGALASAVGAQRVQAADRAPGADLGRSSGGFVEEARRFHDLALPVTGESAGADAPCPPCGHGAPGGICAGGDEGGHRGESERGGRRRRSHRAPGDGVPRGDCADRSGQFRQPDGKAPDGGVVGVLGESRPAAGTAGLRRDPPFWSGERSVHPASCDDAGGQSAPAEQRDRPGDFHRADGGCGGAGRAERAFVAAAPGADMPDDAYEPGGDGLPEIPLEQLDKEQVTQVAVEVMERLVTPIIGEAGFSVELTAGRVNVAVDCGENSGLLIGREGQTLSALQYLASRIVSRRFGAAVRVQLDSGDYRERQDDKLRDVALYLAERVRATGRPQSTRPLSSYHRRVVHVALQDDAEVVTRSKGDGPLKRVIIMGRRKG